MFRTETIKNWSESFSIYIRTYLQKSNVTSGRPAADAYF